MWGALRLALAPSHPPASPQPRRPRLSRVLRRAFFVLFGLSGCRVSPETNQEGPRLGGLYESLTPTQTLPPPTPHPASNNRDPLFSWEDPSRDS